MDPLGIVESTATPEQFARLLELFGEHMDLFVRLSEKDAYMSGGAALYVHTGIGPVGDIDFFVDAADVCDCAEIILSIWPSATIERTRSVITIGTTSMRPIQLVCARKPDIAIKYFDFDYCQCSVVVRRGNICLLATNAAIRAHQTHICEYFRMPLLWSSAEDLCPIEDLRLVDRVRKLQQKGFRLPPDIHELRDLCGSAHHFGMTDITYENRMEKCRLPIERQPVTRDRLGQYTNLEHSFAYSSKRYATECSVSLYDIRRLCAQTKQNRWFCVSPRFFKYHTSHIPRIETVRDYFTLGQFRPTPYYSTLEDAFHAREILTKGKKCSPERLQHLHRVTNGIRCVALARAFACPESPACEWAGQAGHTLRKIFKYVMSFESQ